MSRLRPNLPSRNTPLSIWEILGWSILALTGFHLAYALQRGGGWIVLFLWSIWELTAIGNLRRGFYLGLVLGLAMVAPHLAFFWGQFGLGALGLWLVLAIFIALFLGLAQIYRHFLRGAWAALAIAGLWTGLEFFRSELNPIRFSWLNSSFCLSESPLSEVLPWIGSYGWGFLVLMLMGLLAPYRWPWRQILVVLACLTGFLPQRNHQPDFPIRGPHIAGLQFENIAPGEIPPALDKLLERYPQTELVVLPEFSITGAPTESLREWCRQRKKFLLVSGMETIGQATYNTSFVLDPDGVEVFKQGKAVPVPFMKDGLPAKEQRVWNSPWGKLGVCICYDLSFGRVTDELVRQGALALLVPTMDLDSWGAYEHRLHGRVAPVRAAEYGLPIVRICSSGISQIVDGHGRVLVSAPYPGFQESLGMQLPLSGEGHVPGDRVLGWMCVVGSLIGSAWYLRKRQIRRRPSSARALTMR